MAELVPFVPRADLAATKNMQTFIRYCQEELTVFGADLDFDASTWDVTDFFQMRGKNHRLRLHFVDIAQQQGVLGCPMPEPFARQAKAYIRYYAGWSAKNSPPYAEINALKALLAAFRDKAMVPDLSSVDAQLLDHAVQLAAARIPGDHAPRIGVHLGALATFLREKNLAALAPIDWKHGQEWQWVKRAALGRKERERRERSLPSQDALIALPEAYRIAKEPRDVIATSVMALLSCAPSRINEIFALPYDCELKPLTEGEEGYVLSWPGSKGYYRNFAKGIPAVMADVARDALDRLRKHTSEARRIAAWYEQHPDQLYLPEDCAHLRGRNLTGADLACIIGFADPKNGRDWALDQKLTPVERVRVSSGHTAYAFRFSDVENAILSLLPFDFPMRDRATGLRYSDALMVVRRQEFYSRGRMRWRCMIAPVTSSNIQSSFYRGDRDGVFARLGLSTAEHPIILKSNQLRHYLNTLAQRGGLSEMEIAAWSGRNDVRQNAAYDHRTPEEMLERKRRRERELATISGGAARTNPPVARTEGAARASHGHATEIGFCEHDFASSPCAMFMECLHCTKHVCVKGYDPRHLERVELALESARHSLAEAEQARAKDYEGAEDWIRAHQETIQRLEQLHAILNDPAVPDGSLIRLAKSGRYSLVEQAMRDHEDVTGALPWNHPSGPAIPAGRGDA